MKNDGIAMAMHYEILVADDNTSNLQLLGTVLAEESYRVRLASTGRMALRSISAKLPDLILLDINMPDVNGYEVCRQLKADPKTKDIPVIFISAYDSEDDRVKGFDIGGVDYITKPFQVRDVLVRVSNHLQLNRMRTNLEEIVQERTAELRAEITERKRAEDALKKAQVYILNIIDSMPSVIISVDAVGKVTKWNKEAHRTTGISAQNAVGHRLDVLIPHLAGEMERVGAAIELRQKQSESRKTRSINGQTCYEDVSVFPLIGNGVDGAVIRIDDVTEKVRLEEIMIQNEKVLSLGGLAAGMAHEINNPLAGMLQSINVIENRLLNLELKPNLDAAQTLGLSLSSTKQYMEVRGIPKMIGSVRESALRLSGIVENMLTFARKSDGSLSSHSPVELVESAIQLAQTDYSLKKQYDFKTIEIVKEYQGDLPKVPCERSKIQQVLLNMLHNGAQAMQEVAGHQPRFILRLSHETRTNMLRIEIEDNGPGMGEKTRKRVFEPFFTTKPTGVGTGIGLSVSYYIVTENHGGTIEIVSEPQKGTNFIIRLPL